MPVLVLCFFVVPGASAMAQHQAIRAPRHSHSLENWEACLWTCPEVVLVQIQPVVKANGQSRKRVLDEAVVRHGGGHFCPPELCLFAGGTTNARLFTTARGNPLFLLKGE